MPKYKTTLPKEEKEIIRIVNEFGCISYPQLQHYFNELTEERIQFFSQYLYNSAWIDILEGNVVVPFGRKDVDHNMVDCLWIVLNNLENIPDRHMIFRGETPASVIFQDAESVVNIVVRLKAETIPSIDILQERYFARSADENGEKTTMQMQYIFVIDNEKYLDIIANKGLKLAHKIALISTDQNTPEDISYFA